MFNRLGGAPLPLEGAYPSYIQETLPPSKLGYATNHQYPRFPPKMADGRSLISSWNPESVIDKMYKEQHQSELVDMAPLNPNWAYRRHMQKHGYHLMGQNFRETANDTGSAVPLLNQKDIDLQNNSRNVPYRFTSLMDPALPPGMVDSNLKSLYLTREQLASIRSAPVIS